MLAFLSPNQLVLSAVSKKEWPITKVFLHGMAVENSSIPISILNFPSGMLTWSRKSHRMNVCNIINREMFATVISWTADSQEN